MRSSEDNADDEFVFVANKTASSLSRGYYQQHQNAFVSFSSPSSVSSLPAYHTNNRSPRSHPRLNHLQPIPTTLDLMPSPIARTLTNASTTTTSKSKATPLPPELIELLPPHLRENTVPDYSASKSPFSTDSSPFSKGSYTGEESLPERPPLPTTYCQGDYCNLESPTTPTISPSTATNSPSSSLSHNYAYLSDIITSDPLQVLASTTSHATRASSLTSSRPSSRNCSSNTLTSSNTAPAALGLTDSGISSGGSSSSSSNSSRSNSSRSLPRDGSKTCLNGRPYQPPPSPKFTRSPLAGTPSPLSGSNSHHHQSINKSSLNSSNKNLDSIPSSTPLTKVSYTAVLASDGEKASMYRKLEALTPTPSPLLNNFRANSNPQAVTDVEPISPITSSSSSSSLSEGAGTHTHHVTTTHTTLDAMGQCTSNVTNHTSTPVHTPSATPTGNRTPVHTPTPGRKTKHVPNGVTNAAAITHIKGREGVSPSAYTSRERVTPPPYTSPSPSPSRHASPLSRNKPNHPYCVNNNSTVSSPLTSTSGVSHSIGQISNSQPTRVWRPSPPPSPEVRRAWNVVGVPPVDSSISTPNKGRSPASSPVPRSSYSTMSGSDPDSIYDNLVVRQPPLATPTPRPTPMASVPPIFTPVTSCHSVQSHQTNPYQGSLRGSPSPSCGKPLSPQTQRRVISRSPTPTGAWVATPGGGPVINPQFVPSYTTQDGPYGGCWVPVWGSSPQLYHGEGGPVVYPAYVYQGHGGLPLTGTGPISAVPPSGVIIEGRSHSCDRMLPSRPSPPSSPRTGRRSASPWRGGSASPHHRHSPSPDPSSGRPPRPRRPAMRKSKTVEVGFLGVGNQPSFSGGEGPCRTAGGGGGIKGYHNGYVGSPQGPNQVGLPLSPGSPQGNYPQGHTSSPSGSSPYHTYANIPQHNRSLISDNHDKRRQSPNVRDKSPHSYRSYSVENVNLSHELTSPSLVNSAFHNSNESVNCSSPSAKKGQVSTDVIRPLKVTYKTSLYKCMKNLLLKPMQ